MPGISQDSACRSCSQASLFAEEKQSKVHLVLQRSQGKTGQSRQAPSQGLALSWLNSNALFTSTQEARIQPTQLALAAMDAQQSAGLRTTEDDGWQARNLSTSLSRVLNPCRLGYTNVQAVYARLWRDVQPMLLPELSHLFSDRYSRGSKRLKTGTVRNTLRLRYGAFWNAKLVMRF